MRRRAADRLSARIAPAPEAITEQWSALEADPQTSFHQSRAWVEAWARQQAQLHLNVVSLEHNGVPFAILPLEIDPDRRPEAWHALQARPIPTKTQVLSSNEASVQDGPVSQTACNSPETGRGF
jgi:CelD/BcsL family acetyltransferase involved in cellulose biosynthesis